ncbi:MAG: type II toxin-antitoxin system VapB family antitoxin [Chthoniobacteraceae bacterium]|nr:type II toxin-antitoxin system VapB family antitoxin [Chthoniobacteraceae bacterium]
MATNVQLDEKLMTEALRLGKQRSKKALIEEALREYVERRKQAELLGLFGQIDYEADYDYKALRRRQRPA